MSIQFKAIEYSNAGLSVHLLKPGEKRPTAIAWSTAPFMTDDDLKKAFETAPHSNIGVRLGECSRIGSRYLYAFDLDISSNDPRKIKQAYDFMRSVYKNFDQLPCVRSASPNSRHFYFLSKVLLKTKKLGHSDGKVTVVVNGEDKVKNEWEVDLCSTGKQVVLPPSRFNGRTYEWHRDILEYLRDDAKKALMIIDDISVINLYLDSDPHSVVALDPVRSYKIDEIKRYLDRLPPNFIENYDDWLKVGMALHSEFDSTEDEQEAIQLFDDFSKKSDKYKKGEAYSKWKSFNKSDSGITLGTIFYHCPKENSEDRVALFSKFLNAGSVNYETLLEKMRELRLEDHELEMFIDVIATEMTKSGGGIVKCSSVAARKLIRQIKQKIETDEDEKLDQLAIGLDDTVATIILKESFNGGKHLLNLNGNLFAYESGVWVKQEAAVLQLIVLNGIKKIMLGKTEEHAMIRRVIFKKKKNDDIDGLTNKITSLMLKMVATPESKDLLNLRNKAEVPYSVVNTLNKEIYIEHGKMTVEDHKFDSYLISQFNVIYDPEADCPTWKLMLDNVFQKYEDKEEMIRHFCEILGYILQSQKKIAAFVILLGSGRNGKSFFMSQFSKLMGHDSTVNDDILKFSQGAHAESALVGKNMFIDDDWKKGQMLPDDYIKKLSENKTLTANPKFKEQFNFVSRCTPVILSNSSPRSRDTSYGIERRAHVFDFNYRFTEEEIDPRLDEKLKAERSGFLNLLLKSYLDFERRGGFKIPLSVQNSIHNWLRGSSPIMAFLASKAVITNDQTDKVKAQYLFDMYKAFTAGENFSHPMTRTNFYDEMRGINGLSVKMNSSDKNFYIHGIQIASFNP